MVAKAFARLSCVDISFMVALAFARQSCTDGWTVAKALRTKALRVFGR